MSEYEKELIKEITAEAQILKAERIIAICQILIEEDEIDQNLALNIGLH